MSDLARPAMLVSACLLGVPCTHKGESKVHPGVMALSGSARLIPVCPEVAGGLTTPRPSAERGPDGRVRTEDGTDLTEAYERGAAQAVAVAGRARVQRAVLKARSPSCGSRQVYDGTHSRMLVEGEGITAEALRRAGFDVISEEEL